MFGPAEFFIPQYRQIVENIIAGFENLLFPSNDDDDFNQPIDRIDADQWEIFKEWTDDPDPDNKPIIYNQTTQIYQPQIDINLPEVPELPDRRLPKEADGQTAFNTVGASITLQESLQERTFGKLLWNPVKKGKQKLRMAYDPDLAKRLNTSSKQWNESFSDWLLSQIDPEIYRHEDYARKTDKLWSGFCLIKPGHLKGHKESIGFVYGVEYWANLAQSYHLRSLNALMTVRDYLQEEYEIKSNKITVNAPKLTKSDVLELVSLASLFYRSGLHRYPFKLPEFLIPKSKDASSNGELIDYLEEDKEVTITDGASFNEWLVQNLDAIYGEFPIKIKYKNLEGNQKEISLHNLAETLSEMIGMLLNISVDADTAVAIGMKNLIESTKAGNAAIVASDYAKANADFLGYRGKERNHKVKLSYSPGKESLKAALQPSETNVVGYECNDEEDLKEMIGKALFVLQIIKAASYFPFKPGDKITGDHIKEQREEEKEKLEEQLEELINKLNNPSGINKVEGNPTPKIRKIDTTGEP